MKILFFGDIVGKVGRKAMSKVLPSLKEQYQPDVVLANVENLAHGKGVTASTLAEMKALGINGFTSGNHVWKKEDVAEAVRSSEAKLVTPFNDPRTTNEQKFLRLKVAGKELVVVNLLGRTFMNQPDVSCPFKAMDGFLSEHKNFKGPIILDFHAEATSEKIALGWYLDGRISVLLGTHTHVPTADYKILPQGTAYVTDLGMVGPADSVLGVKKELIIEKFLTDGPIVFKYDETGDAEVNAVYLEIDNITNKTVKIEKINQRVSI